MPVGATVEYAVMARFLTIAVDGIHRQSQSQQLAYGCGAGRHAVPLQARGFDVVGIDPSPGALAVCQARGIDARAGTALDLPAGLGTAPIRTFLVMCLLPSTQLGARRYHGASILWG